MNTGEKDRLSPERSARIAALSPEKRALLERRLGATAPIAVARRSEPAAVVRRRDSLRTTFRLEGGGAAQEIRSDLPVRGRLNGAFLVSLTIRDLFENPIVSDLARVVERAQVAGEHAYPPSIPRMARGAATFPGGKQHEPSSIAGISRNKWGQYWPLSLR